MVARRTYSRANKRLRASEEDEEVIKRRKITPPAPRLQPFTSMKAWLGSAPAPSIASDVSAPDESIFSDCRQDITSSPPSSPPPMLSDSLDASSNAHFLAPISDNIRTIAPKTAEKALIQAQINVGSSLRKTCKECGMTFLRTSREDTNLHDRYHTNSLQGLDCGKAFRKWAEASALWRGESGAVVVLVDASHERFQRGKVEEALAIVQGELGAVDIPLEDLWAVDGGAKSSERMRRRYRALLYMVGTRCAGFCLVKAVKTGHPTIANPDSTEQGWKLSDEQKAVRVGISRIWCSKAFRKRRVASTLLDMAVRYADEAGRVSRSAVAFSQPTTSGTGLARRWFGKQYGWAVYVE